MTSTNSEHILALATYRLKPVASEDQIVDASERFSAWLRQQPGFVSRQFSYSESEDTYIDVIYWETMAAAEMAAALSMNSDECAPFFSLGEPETVKVLHAGPVAATAAV